MRAFVVCECMEEVKAKMWNALTIGDLTAAVPIIQGGMGIGISLGRLAGTVAKAGGIGIISAVQIGFKEADFSSRPKEANIRAMKAEYDKARQIATTGIIGFNLMTAVKFYDEYARAAASIGADIIISGAGLPLDLPAYVSGSRTKIAPIISTERAGQAILKYWDRKYHRTADFIVIESPLAGGHLGFTKELIHCYYEKEYVKEIRKIIQVVRLYEKQYNCLIPVILAGGIDCTKQVQHAFDLGASGVQVGTAFVTTEECDADIAFKESYIKATEKDIVIIDSPVQMPGRAIQNSFLRQVIAGKTFPPVLCHQCLKKCNPATIPYCITERLIAAANGAIPEALLFCGANAYKADKITTVKTVIKNLMKV